MGVTYYRDQIQTNRNQKNVSGRLFELHKPLNQNKDYNQEKPGGT